MNGFRLATKMVAPAIAHVAHDLGRLKMKRLRDAQMICGRADELMSWRVSV